MKKLVLALMTLPLHTLAQKSIPVNVSVFNESTAIPFTRFFTTPVHPGLQLGMEFNYKTGKHTRLFQTANISYFYHNYLAWGLALHTELGYEYRIKQGVSVSGLLGLGYMHTFATTEEYRFSNGHYEQKADKGNARLYPSLSVDVGYYLKPSVKNSPRVFLRYQSWVEYPYSPGFIPVMAHINLHIGAKFFITPKTRKND